MRAIEEIKVKLEKYPHVRYESDESSISVLPTSDDGFTVSLYEHESDFTVSFNGWHEEFQGRDEALNCFAFGLSPECRLKEVRRGNFVYKWTVESREDGMWAEDATTGLFLFPFWRKKEVRYLQNDLLGDEVSQ